MIEKYTELLELVEATLIHGIFFSVALIIFVKLLSKNKIKTALSVRIIRLILVTYALATIVHLVCMLVFNEWDSYAFLSRLTGQYRLVYIFMLLSNTIVPLVLIHNKIGRKLGLLFTIALVMNFGWIMESIIIHITNTHRCVGATSYGQFWHTNTIISAIYRGLILGAVLTLVEQGIKKWRNS